MRIKVVTVVSALVFLIGIQITPVKAFDISNGGFAFGVTGNFSSFDTSGNEREGNSKLLNPALETTTFSTSKDIEFGSAFVEYAIRGDDLLYGIPGLTIGVEYIPGAAELGAKTRTDTTGSSAVENDTGTYTAKAEISDHFTVYVEPTLYAGKYFGVYAKAAASRITVKTLESLGIGNNSSTYDDAHVWGTTHGFGLRATSPWGIFVKVEYTETDYGTIELQSAGGNENLVTANPDQDSTRVMIGLMF